jgi:hypothetical protein
MAPPELLALHDKKKVDSISKHDTEVLQYNAPPLPDDVIDLNTQFKK